MEIDGALVMNDFVAHMSDLIMLMGFAAVVSLALTGVYSYFVHDRGESDEN